MQLFHSQSRSDRRRRTLVDAPGAEGAPPQPAKASRSRKAPPAYTNAARQEHARRVTDLFPRTYLSLALIFLSGVTAIAGLIAGHVCLPQLASLGSKDGFAALDLSSRGSLASWLSSLMFALASIASLVVWSVRRHKLDDYRGHYRWWLVAAVAWLLMSVDATTGLHDALRVVMTRLSATVGPLAGHGWWIGIWGLILVTTVTRLMLDMRQCRAALVITALSMVMWIGSLVARFAELQLDPAHVTLIIECTKLVGHLLLVEGLLLYSRYVILHSQGMLPTRDSKRKEKAKKESAKAAANMPATARVDAAHAQAPAPHGEHKHAPAHSHAATQSHASQQASNTDDDQSVDDEDDDDRGGGRKLTKAERKKMRKQKFEDRDW